MTTHEWVMAGLILSVFVLWMRVEVLAHKHDVLRAEHDESCANCDRRLQGIRDDCLSWLEFSEFSQRIHERLDKLDPPRRRSTDKKPCPVAITGKQFDWVWADEPPTRMKARKKKAAKR